MGHSEVMAKLREQHGQDVFEVKGNGGKHFAFRKATLEEWGDYADGIATRSESRPAGVCMRELCLKTLVLGEVDDLSAWFLRAPRAPALIARQLSELADGGIEAKVAPDPKYGSVVHVDGSPCTFRAPELEEWEAFQDKVGQAGFTETNRELCDKLLCGGSQEAWLALQRKAPRISTTVVDLVSELAEDGIRIVVKKG